jgi:hypothetical protein
VELVSLGHCIGRLILEIDRLGNEPVPLDPLEIGQAGLVRNGGEQIEQLGIESAPLARLLTVSSVFPVRAPIVLGQHSAHADLEFP